MKKGGYKIIDLKGTSLSGTPVTIDGVYDLIEGNYGKAVMVSGINIGGTEKPDAYVQFSVDSGSYVAEIYGKILTITADDEVSVADPEVIIPKKYYLHNIEFIPDDLSSTAKVRLQILTSQETAFTYNTMHEYLKTYAYWPAFGVYTDSTACFLMLHIIPTAGEIDVYYEGGSKGTSTVSSFTDTVTEL